MKLRYIRIHTEKNNIHDPNKTDFVVLSTIFDVATRVPFVASTMFVVSTTVIFDATYNVVGAATSLVVSLIKQK